MHAVRIDEILLRRGGSGLVRVIAPPVPAHLETALGRPFGFICINVPRTPQIDALVTEVEAVLERAYTTGSLRPGQGPEQFFEETVAKVRTTVAASLAQSRIKIDPSLMTITLGCVAGSNIYLTRHGQAEAYLIRRQTNHPTKTIDVFRGFGDDADGRLLDDLIVGTVTENDLLLTATTSLFAIAPIADIVETTNESEPAAVAARVRSIILSSPGTEAVAGCLMRLSPVRAMFRAKENASISNLRSREEEVARTLSPSGLPGVGAFLDRFKPKEKPPRTNKPVKTSAPAEPKRPLIERFNTLPTAAKRAAIILLALLAIFLVSLKLIANDNTRKTQAKQFAAAIEAIKKQIDLSESTMLYDETRARAVLDGAAAAEKSLSGKTPAENAAKTKLEADLATADRKLKHLYTAAPQTIETTNAASSFVVKTASGWLTNAGPNLIALDANGSPTNIATLPDEPLWAAPTGNAEGNIFLWLKNSTLVEISTQGKALPHALDYAGPANPRAGAMWSGRLYVLAADGTQVWKLPPTLTGFGKGSAYLASPLTGKGAPGISIDGAVYLPVPGDAVRRFEKGKIAAFAAASATANADPAALFLGTNSLYLLGADNSIAVWDKNGQLQAQYALPANTGKVASFAVDETAKQVVYVTDKGVVSKFEMIK